jgi:hypothetical protein
MGCTSVQALPADYSRRAVVRLWRGRLDAGEARDLLGEDQSTQEADAKKMAPDWRCFSVVHTCRLLGTLLRINILAPAAAPIYLHALALAEFGGLGTGVVVAYCKWSLLTANV